MFLILEKCTILKMDKKILLLLIVIFVIAAFFRLWQLSSIPPGLYPDVAINGNDVLASLKSGDFKVFYPDNNGREGLFMWLIALSFLIFGVSVWSIKITAATLGILTVLGTYLLTKELFSKNNPTIIALLSSFFLATSFWHTNFSRIGFRAIMLPFILVFAFYFLFLGLREKRVFWYVISGIFFGLGFYTYTTYRFVVLLLPLILIFWHLIYKNQGSQKKFLLSAFYFLFSIWIIALPLGIYFLGNPQDFISRATGVSIFLQENPIKAFGESLVLHLGMFNFYGDYNWRHNFSKSPMLPWPLGILFLIGVILSFREIFRKSNYQEKNYQSLFIFYFLISTFFLMLLPGILTYEGIPHSLRVIGVIPVVYILVAFGAWKTYEFLSRKLKRKKLFAVLGLMFLVIVAASEFNKYFFNWAKRQEVKDAFTQTYENIGYFLNSLPENVQKYVIVNELGRPLYGISIPAQTPMFIESSKYGRPNSIYLKAEDLNDIRTGGKKTIIVPLYENRIFEELQKKFPQGKIREIGDFKFYEI